MLSGGLRPQCSRPFIRGNFVSEFSREFSRSMRREGFSRKALNSTEQQLMQTRVGAG